MPRKRMIDRLRLLAGGAVAIGFLSAITMPLHRLPQSSLAQATTPKASPTAPVPRGSRMMGQADQRFIVMMIPHHQDAVAMADLALIKAKHPEIKKLAAAIKRDQTREIQQMQAWYRQWYGAEVPAWNPGKGMGMMHSGWDQDQSGNMGCGMKRVDLSALKTAADFDRAFIEDMIPHHQMAVMMTHMIWNSQHPELRSLANGIAKTQTAEINQMQQWYLAWYQS